MSESENQAPPAFPSYPTHAERPLEKLHHSGERSQLALVALISSLLGFVTCVGFPLALILGHHSLKKFREMHLRQEQPPQGRGYALAAVIISYSSLAIGFIVFLMKTIPEAVG